MKRLKYIIIATIVLMIFSSILPVSVQSKIDAHRVLEYGKPVPILFIHGYDDEGKSWKESTFYQWAELQGIPVEVVDYKEYNRNDFTSNQIQNIVKETIAKLPEDEPFDIVAHSMGGLVTRWFLKENPDYEKRVRRVIMIGTPNHGSPVATKNRISSIIDQPHQYMDDEQLKQVEEYKNYYKEYIIEAFDNFSMEQKGKLSFEKWLFQKEPELRKKLVDKSVAQTSMENHQVVDGGFEGRYTNGFLTYVQISTGRVQARVELMDLLSIDMRNSYFEDRDPIDTSTNFPDISSLDEFTGLKEFDFWKSVNSAKNIVQDRLALEYITLTTEIDKDGKLIREQIVANPVLYEMAKYEFDHRKEKINKQRYVPQYLTIATTAPDSTIKSLMSGFIKDLPYWKFEDHDFVVPISSVKLDYSYRQNGNLIKNYYLDRHIEVINQKINHKKQMNAEDILIQEYSQVITGKNDADVYFEMSLEEEQTFELQDKRKDSRYTAVIQPTKNTLGEEFTLTFKGFGKSIVPFYVVKRNEYQQWGDIQKYYLESLDTSYEKKINLKLMENEDLLIFTDNKLSVTITPKEVLPDEGERFYLEIIENRIENGKVIQFIRVIDRKTGKPKRDLVKRDITLTLEDDRNLYSFEVDKIEKAINVDDNILVSIDHSGSMKETTAYYKSLKQTEVYISSLIHKQKDVKLGVIGFATNVKSIVPFTNNLDSVYKHMYESDINGGTAMYDSIIIGSRSLSLHNGQRRLILLTDGLDNESTATIEDAIAVANEHNISVYPVALGHNIDSEALIKLAKDTGGQFYSAENANQLSEMFTTITVEVDTTYAIEYPITTLENGTNKIAIELTNGRSNQVESEITKIDRNVGEIILDSFQSMVGW
ncbi:MAG TPA: alpha/beta fold hydrolase [Ureibacillus sp.]|nr:alpha/beta fold hydrolase [Ureibacillus sp.]